MNSNEGTQSLPMFTNYTILLHLSCSGPHSLLNISSKPTLHELDKLIMDISTRNWEQVALCLGVESCLIDLVKEDNRGQSAEACRAVLNTWLNGEPGAGVAERTWHSVLKALETSGHRQLAEQLKREQFGETSEGPVSGLISQLGMCLQLHIQCFSCHTYTVQL